MTPTVSASAVVPAAPESVWALVADVTRMGEWSPECDSCEWLGGATGPDVGATFKGHNKRGISKWSTTCTVIECEPGRVFAFAVGKPEAPANIWRYSFVPSADGTMVTETCEFPKPMGLGENGLPLSVQIAAAQFRDDLVFRAARAIEIAQPFPTLD